MLVSLIIITRELDQRLDYCLAAVHAHRPAANQRILVIDDPRQPDAPDMASDWHVVRGSGKGRAAARNAGAHAARGEILVFLDGDVLTTVDFIERLVDRVGNQVFVRSRILELVGAAVCSDLELGGPGFPALRHAELANRGFLPHMYRTAANVLEQAVEARFIGNDRAIPAWIASAGAGFAVRRDVWMRLGGQEERFGRNWGCEDLEFSYRLARSETVDYAPDAVVYHLSHRQEARWSQHGQTLELFQALHPDPAVLRLALLLSPSGSLARFRESIISGSKPCP